MSALAEGVLNIDKSAGVTSHDVVNRVRRLIGIRRVGHAGTLDPLATGVLLLCVGRATRLVEYLMGHRKRYRATIRLGQETNTYDSEGDIVSESPVNVSQEAVAATLDRFRGDINQYPPRYSAIKIDGQPMYKRARRGEQVESPLRQVTIYDLELLTWDPPQLVLELACSSGTYVRSIAHDLGRELGCGGHLSALRRIEVGEFSVEEAVSPDALVQEKWSAIMMPSDVAVQHLPRLDIAVEQAINLFHGRSIPVSEGHPIDDLVRVYDDAHRFVGVAVRDGELWRPRKILYRPDEKGIGG